MGRNTSKCKASGEAAVMEKEAAAAAAGRKRKTISGESELSKSSIQLKTRRFNVMTPENSASPASSCNSSCETVSSGHVLASCCSSSRPSELTEEIVDLEQENEVTVEFITTSADNSVDFRDRREKLSSEIQAESGELESTARPRQSNSRRCSAAEKMPTEAELEEFFAEAEKNLQKQFIDKYNYDIIKDEPLEGRYEWVRIHH